MDDKELKQEQVRMHKDFFDKCDCAIENGFYLEAIFLEYAAIESRLEIICGVLGLPCNKELPFSERKNVNISQRILCIKETRNKHPEVFKRSKIKDGFFYKKQFLSAWITKRNTYIHGLYKNAFEYKSRKSECKEIAINGREYARLLYNEAARLRRLSKSHPELFVDICFTKNNGECYKKNN
ncbi:MAG: hypothetical protein IKS12_00175 [Eubacterium sp.]|nr:hypothetical protein [Eubacterium sp.]